MHGFNSQLSFYEYPTHKPFINTVHQPLRPSHTLSNTAAIPESNRDHLLTALQSLSIRIKKLEGEREVNSVENSFLSEFVFSLRSFSSSTPRETRSNRPDKADWLSWQLRQLISVRKRKQRHESSSLHWLKRQLTKWKSIFSLESRIKFTRDHRRDPSKPISRVRRCFSTTRHGLFVVDLSIRQWSDRKNSFDEKKETKCPTFGAKRVRPRRATLSSGHEHSSVHFGRVDSAESQREVERAECIYLSFDDFQPIEEKRTRLDCLRSSPFSRSTIINSV